jgi:hypothetical protein
MIEKYFEQKNRLKSDFFSCFLHGHLSFGRKKKNIGTAISTASVLPFINTS